MVSLVLSSLLGILETHEAPALEDFLRCRFECSEAYRRCLRCKGGRIVPGNRHAYCHNLLSVCFAECDEPSHYVWYICFDLWVLNYMKGLYICFDLCLWTIYAITSSNLWVRITRMDYISALTVKRLIISLRYVARWVGYCSDFELLLLETWHGKHFEMLLLETWHGKHLELLLLETWYGKHLYCCC